MTASKSHGLDTFGWFPWRSERQLRGLQSRLVTDLMLGTDGAHITIDIKTAEALIEVLRQARQTERGGRPKS